MHFGGALLVTGNIHNREVCFYLVTHCIFTENKHDSITSRGKSFTFTTYVWPRDVYPNREQQKVRVCENDWFRRIVGVKRADKRRIGELRVEFGVKETFKKKLVRSRLK